jgi:hypothetical protein
MILGGGEICHERLAEIYEHSFSTESNLRTTHVPIGVDEVWIIDQRREQYLELMQKAKRI